MNNNLELATVAAAIALIVFGLLLRWRANRRDPGDGGIPFLENALADGAPLTEVETKAPARVGAVEDFPGPVRPPWLVEVLASLEWQAQVPPYPPNRSADETVVLPAVTAGRERIGRHSVLRADKTMVSP